MSADSRLIVAGLLITIAILEPSHCFQQVWRKSGRIRPSYGSITDPDTTDLVIASDSLSEEIQSTAAASSDDTLLGENIQSQPVDAPARFHDSDFVIAPLPLNTSNQLHNHLETAELSRRRWLKLGAVAVGSAFATRLVDIDSVLERPDPVKSKAGTSKVPSAGQHPKTSSSTKPPSVAHPIQRKKLQPVNVTAVVRETNINLTMECTNTCVSLDRYTFEKKATFKLPGWVPSFLIPPPRTIRKLSDSEILIAALVAGSTVREMCWRCYARTGSARYRSHLVVWLLLLFFAIGGNGSHNFALSHCHTQKSHPSRH
jgi:hypothetical protein